MDRPFLGEICLFPFNFVPIGWMACEGQLLHMGQFTALFELVGTTFGGDGMTHFALPDLRGKAPPELQYFISMTGISPSRN
jgi:microcystin-dependent protein